MDNNLIGVRDFTDGTTRPVYADEHGEYVIGDDGARVYGVWLVPADEPLILELPDESKAEATVAGKKEMSEWIVLKDG